MLKWVLVAGLSLPGVGRAQAVLDAILQRGTVRVGMTGDYRPFAMRDGASPDGMSGLDVDMARSLATALGVKLEIVRTAWPRLTDDLVAQKFDVAMGGVSITTERAKRAVFSAPVLRAGKAALVRCADKDRYKDLGSIDQPGVRVMANAGGTNEQFDRGALKRASVLTVDDNQAQFDALLDGRADVVITDSVETRIEATLHAGKLCSVNDDKPFTSEELAYMLPRDWVWLNFVNIWLHNQQLSGERQKILAAWMK